MIKHLIMGYLYCEYLLFMALFIIIAPLDSQRKPNMYFIYKSKIKKSNFPNSNKTVVSNTLSVNEILHEGEFLLSSNGQYQAVLQSSDGNFCINVITYIVSS